MLKGALVALTAVLALAPAARAQSREAGTASVLPPSPSARTSFAQEVATVETRPSPAGIIVRDVFGGALAGTAGAGAYLLYDHYVTNNGNGGWGNWGRVLGIGAGIGAAVGLIFGAVDAASNADRRFTGPVADERPTGFAPAVATYGRRF